MSGFDRGMDDAYCGFGPSSRGGDDYQEGYAYGLSLVEQMYQQAAEKAYYEQLAAAEQQYYAQAECEHYGHERHGDDDKYGPRCYCGKVRWMRVA